jgi:isopentenyl-diphosphate delta-isomerase
METAIHRRLHEELGLRCPLQFLFKFQYQAQFDATGSEQELCSVFIGRSPTRSDRSERDSRVALGHPEALQAELTGQAARAVHAVVQVGVGTDLAGSPRQPCWLSELGHKE